MNDLESTISGILSDPDAMRQIQELGKSLGFTGSDQSAEKANAPYTAPPAKKISGFDLSSLSSLISNGSGNTLPDTDTIGSIAKFLPLIKGMNKDDETTALLNALRPFLSAEKRRKLDDASKMLKVMRMLPFLKTQGLF